MSSNRCKTSLKITFEQNGSAKIEEKWSSLDQGHGKECAERIIAEITKIPNYKWLYPLIQPYLAEKYCDQCIGEDNCENHEPQKEFPYCFTKKSDKIKDGPDDIYIPILV